MGMDISHVQLTVTPRDDNDFWEVSDWDSFCNVPLKHYLNYVTLIDAIVFNKSVLIVENEEKFEKLKKSNHFRLHEYLNVFFREPDYDTMKEVLYQFIVKQNLNKLKRMEFSNIENGIEYHTISFGEYMKVKGVYYTDDIGYQRNGMDDTFYNKFKKYEVWGKKEDFDLAYDCVGGDWYFEHWGQEAVNEMKENFKRNFVDKFEFGKSLLCV